MKYIKSSFALLLLQLIPSTTEGIYLWVKSPPRNGEYLMIHEQDLVEPDLIDNLVDDGFAFEK